jgi:ubiquinone/menaquinone biosynthesis C-methylase UbiE
MKPTYDLTQDCAGLVRDGYNRCADLYATARPDTPHRLLLTLVDELPIDATALDIGCGAGIPVSRVLTTRAAVTGIDISSRMIALAQQNVPTARFIEADIRAVDFPPESFDAVTAFYSIFHLPKGDHQTLLGSIYSWLKPGGLLLCTLSYANEAAYTEDSFFGVTMYWSNHSLSQYDQMLTKVGFELLESTVLGSGFAKPENEEAHPLLLLRKPKPQNSQPAGAGDA